MARSVLKSLTADLNEEQAAAVEYGDGPLLIIAGAGTGKTNTLVHRVAALIARGIDPSRVLLLTFTRRAASEMLRRVERLLAHSPDTASKRRSGPNAAKVWGGTFHATAARLLRTYGPAIGLDAGFTIHDRTDSEDLMDVLRTELGFAKSPAAFPKKGTLMAIYSHCVNAQRPLEQVLADQYAAHLRFGDKLKRLFTLYTTRKQESNTLDYDDLLLFWLGLLSDPEVGQRVRERFSAVLVDEYQDTNRLQSEILQKLCPDGRGLTVVGDDAQSIYSFRAATVRNILDFPQHYPGAQVLKLQQNYRSVQPILDATNAIIAQSREAFAKKLWTQRKEGEKPWLVMCADDTGQADFVADRILEHREQGIELKRQAVLFRASHNSIMLEAELARRRIPYVKYGGLRFAESAHVKDVMAFLRLAENYRDVAAGTRVLKLLPGIGPQKAALLTALLHQAAGDVRVWQKAAVPAATRKVWPEFLKLTSRLTRQATAPLPDQIGAILDFYEPFLEQQYDNADARRRDLEQLQALSERFPDRNSMITDIALDPPTSTRELPDQAGESDDYLVLSTVHSAKGLEWDVVYAISAIDGVFPFSRAQSVPEQLEEERRLFYVALTRARDWLYVTYPQQTFLAARGGDYGDSYAFSKLSRFITPKVKKLFQETSEYEHTDDDDELLPPSSSSRRRDFRPRWL